MSTPLPRLYLLDVEGTVAPISFVYEQLFPYARAHFEEFLRQSLDELGRSGDDLERDDIAEGSVLRDILTLMKESRNETDPAAPKIMPDHVKAFGSEGTSSSFFTTMEFAMPRILGFVFWLMDSNCPLHNAQPAGAKLKPTIRISPIKGSDMVCLGCGCLVKRLLSSSGCCGRGPVEGRLITNPANVRPANLPYIHFKPAQPRVLKAVDGRREHRVRWAVENE